MLFASTAVFASTPQGTFERTLQVSGPVDLEVLTRSGDVTVRGGRSGSVFIRGKIYVGDHWLIGQTGKADVHEIEQHPPIRQDGNSIHIDYVDMRNISVDYEITVPADTTVRTHSGSGDQTIEGTRGNVDTADRIGRREAGEPDRRDSSADRIGQHARARRSRARCEAAREAEMSRSRKPASGDIDLHTGSGNITVRGVQGGFRGEAGSGDMTAEGTQTGRGRFAPARAMCTCGCPRMPRSTRTFPPVPARVDVGEPDRDDRAGAGAGDRASRFAAKCTAEGRCCACARARATFTFSRTAWSARHPECRSHGDLVTGRIAGCLSLPETAGPRVAETDEHSRMTMFLKELISQGWQSLMRDRMRSALTMLGIVWGLASVVLLLAYGQGLGGCVLHAFLNMGNNVIVIWPGQTSMQAGGQRAGKKVKYELEDVEAIRDEVRMVRAVSGEIDRDFGFKMGTRVVSIKVRGVEMPYGQMRKLDLEDGRYFNESDFADHHRVVILGYKAAKKVFQGAPGVGQHVEIGGLDFEVIGTHAQQDSGLDVSGPGQRGRHSSPSH